MDGENKTYFDERSNWLFNGWRWEYFEGKYCNWRVCRCFVVRLKNKWRVTWLRRFFRRKQRERKRNRESKRANERKRERERRRRRRFLHNDYRCLFILEIGPYEQEEKQKKNLSIILEDRFSLINKYQ